MHIMANEEQAGQWSLRFPFNRTLIDVLKTIPGARWDKNVKVWRASTDYLAALKATGQVNLVSNSLARQQTPLLASVASKLRPYQVEGAQRMCQSPGFLLTFDPRVGKAQPLHSKVLTATGWRKMGELRHGDEVFDPVRGRSIRIVDVFPQGERPIYRVTTNDGASCECDADHLWQVQSHGMRQRGQWVLRTTQQLIEAGLVEHGGRKRWYLPLLNPGPVAPQGAGADLPLDPYVLGVLLGNGTFGASIHFTSADFEIVQLMKTRLGMGARKLDVEVRQRGQRFNEFIIGRTEDSGANDLLDLIREFGLEGKGAHEKFVPPEYIHSSGNALLLAGLLDTDGDTPHSSTVVYNTTSPMLRDAVVEIVGRLGGFASIGVKTDPVYTHNGERRIGRDCWRVYIRLPFCPFLLPRKQKAWSKGPMARSIASIEYVGMAQAQCIKLESPEGLYVTDGYIVTHNTPTAIAAITAKLISGEAKRALVLFPAGVGGEWHRQLLQWANLPMLQIQGTTSFDLNYLAALRAHPYLVVGCQYEALLAKREDDLLKLFGNEPFVMVADECQRVKNRKAPTTKTFLKLGALQNCIHRWGLTGTPMRNRPRDIWAVFEFLYPGSMGGYWQFAKRYAAAFEGTYGWDDSGSSCEDELKLRLEAVSYRLTRAQVASYLPKADRKVVLCEMSAAQRRVYAAKEKAFGGSIASALGGADLEGPTGKALEKLATETVASKIDTCIERLQYHCDERKVKVLVFANFHESLNLLWEKLDPSVTPSNAGQPVKTPLHAPVFCAGGWQLPDKRKKTIEQWRACVGPAVLLCNTIASGIGIDLSDADGAIFIELSWVPADFRQAEDRVVDVHQGKRSTPPWFEYLLVKQTIDEDMAGALLKKVRNIEAVVGSDNELTGMSGTIREGGVVDRTKLGLTSADPEVVQAAIDAFRSRLLSDDDEGEDNHALAADVAEAFDEWETGGQEDEDD